MTPSIRNWQVSPPAGGWGLKYTAPENGSSIQVEGGDHGTVLSTIREWRTNNRLPANDAEVFSYCNGVWCRRDPGRCTEPPPPPEPPAGAARRVLTPVDYGQACWTFLHTFGVSFDHHRWLTAIDQIVTLLNPANPHNNGSGCAACHLHFAQFCDAYPPSRVASAEQAAVWGWLAHDGANVHAGKAHRPSYAVCAAKWGWVPMDAATLETTTASLRR